MVTIDDVLRAAGEVSSALGEKKRADAAADVALRHFLDVLAEYRPGFGGADPEKLRRVFDALESQKRSLADAVAANSGASSAAEKTDAPDPGA